MFTIVVPPDYAEELQQICTLDASQREKLISLLALAWLNWKRQHLSALEVAEDIVRIVREQEIFSHPERLQQWAESMDESTLRSSTPINRTILYNRFSTVPGLPPLYRMLKTLLQRIKAWIICSTNTPFHRRPAPIT